MQKVIGDILATKITEAYATLDGDSFVYGNYFGCLCSRFEHDAGGMAGCMECDNTAFNAMWRNGTQRFSKRPDTF